MTNLIEQKSEGKGFPVNLSKSEIMSLKTEGRG